MYVTLVRPFILEQFLEYSDKSINNLDLKWNLKSGRWNTDFPQIKLKTQFWFSTVS